MSEQGSGVDFVVAAYREDDSWQVESLPVHVADDLDGVITVLRQRPGDGGTLGLLSVDDDFFVLVRVIGAEVRMLLSDVTAATDWPLARAVLEQSGFPLPDDDDRVQPAGDVAIVGDFGLDAMAMAAICDDIDRYPDEMLAAIAARLGFGDQFDDAIS